MRGVPGACDPDRWLRTGRSRVHAQRSPSTTIIAISMTDDDNTALDEHHRHHHMTADETVKRSHSGTKTLQEPNPTVVADGHIAETRAGTQPARDRKTRSSPPTRRRPNEHVRVPTHNTSCIPTHPPTHQRATTSSTPYVCACMPHDGWTPTRSSPALVGTDCKDRDDSTWSRYAAQNC